MPILSAGRQAARSTAFAVIVATFAHLLLLAMGWQAPGSPTASQTMVVQAAALVVFVGFGPVLHQDPAYHLFADARPLPLCCSTYVPNAADVLSNVLFMLFGLDGLLALRVSVMESAIERQAWYLLFLAAVFVAFGSSYYHWRPTSTRLVWDRLPMSVGFAAVIFIVLIERLAISVSSSLLYVFVFASTMTTLYWAWTDDLRPYLIVQYYGFLLVLEILLLFESPYTLSESWIWILATYGLAKVFEALDRQVFNITRRMISGHTLKHLVASALFLLASRYIRFRELRSERISK